MPRGAELSGVRAWQRYVPAISCNSLNQPFVKGDLLPSASDCFKGVHLVLVHVALAGVRVREKSRGRTVGVPWCNHLILWKCECVDGCGFFSSRGCVYEWLWYEFHVDHVK